MMIEWDLSDDGNHFAKLLYDAIRRTERLRIIDRLRIRSVALQESGLHAEARVLMNFATDLEAGR